MNFPDLLFFYIYARKKYFERVKNFNSKIAKISEEAKK